MDAATTLLTGCAIASVLLIAWIILVARGWTLRRVDAALRRRSAIAWMTFRVFAGTLAALGLFCWIGLWFQRGFWLGVAQALMCIMVLANELGLLRSGIGGAQDLAGGADAKAMHDRDDAAHVPLGNRRR